MPGVIPKQLTKLLVLKILVIAKSKVIFVALTFTFYNECYRSNLTFLDQRLSRRCELLLVYGAADGGEPT